MNDNCWWLHQLRMIVLEIRLTNACGSTIGEVYYLVSWPTTAGDSTNWRQQYWNHDWQLLVTPFIVSVVLISLLRTVWRTSLLHAHWWQTNLDRRCFNNDPKFGDSLPNFGSKFLWTWRWYLVQWFVVVVVNTDRWTDTSDHICWRHKSILITDRKFDLMHPSSWSCRYLVLNSSRRNVHY